MNRRIVSGLSLFVFLLAAIAFGDATTGTIQGHVTTADGGPLPGATVEASGPSVQGIKVTTTDAGGHYALAFLPPGRYEVRISSGGFQPMKKTGVVVSLGQTANYDAILKMTLSEEVSVEAAAPLIDRTSTRLGENLDEKQITSLPTGRSYASVAQNVAGASTDNANGEGAALAIYGSSGSENTYLVDGINTTNAEYGLQGKELNFEFIQEVEVKTGGYEAEYGRSTGGIINVITKSGGNEFHGDAFGYYDNDSLQSNNRHKDEVIGGALLGFTKKDFGLDLGGFLMKDKLWFFAAYDRVDQKRDNAILLTDADGNEIPDQVTAKRKRDLSSAKLTWRLTDSVSAIGTYLGDPSVATGAIVDSWHGLYGDRSTFLGRSDQGGRDYSLRGEAIPSPSWLASVQVSRHEEKNSQSAASSDGEGIQYIDHRADDYATGGFGYVPKKKFTRDFFGAAAQGFFGDHSIKGGFEFQKDEADVTKTFTGGQQVAIFDNPNDPSHPIYQHSYWTTPEATEDNAPISKLVANPKHDNTTVYLQDKWTPSANFTLSAGLRWDRQQIKDYSGATVIDLKKNFAPRVGFVWNPLEGTSSRAYGSYGLYFEEIPMDLVIRSYSFERQAHIYNFDPVGVSRDPGAEAIVGDPSNILGQAWSERSDPNLRGQSLEEIVLGWDQEPMPGLRLGAKFIYRRYKEVIEDFLCDPASGEYCIGNPGRGIMKEIYNENYDDFGYTAPKAQRQYHGYQLDAEKRTETGRYTASYIYSLLKGNYDGEFAPFTNVGPDPNISAAYDYYEFTINNRGWLSNDRRHQLRITGTQELPYGIQIGFSAYYKTGTPLTRMGFDDGYGRYEHFLTTRGAEGRTPDTYEADLHVGYAIPAGPAQINVLLDVFNLFDAQKATSLDQRWDFEQAGNSGNYPGNDRYLKPLLRQDPRSLRLGLRITY